MSPVYPTFCLLSCPYPPSPFPAGRGKFLLFYCKGLRPLHPRGWRGATLVRRALAAPGGGLPGWSPNNLAIPAPGGGLPSLSTVYPAFCFLSRPIPPTPSRRKGEIFVILCKGLRPLHPRGWWDAALVRRALAAPGGGLPGWSPVLPAVPAPGGGLAVFVACLPCLLLTFLPLSPVPLPGGKGGAKVILCKGLRPLHPRGWLGAALVRRALAAPGGGLAVFVACLPCLLLAFLPPSPHPLPRWGRGRFLLSYARGFAPCIPGAGGTRHWFGGRWRHPAGACPVGRRITLPF